MDFDIENVYLSLPESLDFVEKLGTMRSMAMAGTTLKSNKHALAMYRMNDSLYMKFKLAGPVIAFRFGKPISSNFVIPTVSGNNVTSICSFAIFFVGTYAFPPRFASL